MQRLIGGLLLCFLVGAAFAATESYDYDPLMRLIRAVNGAGKTTEYVYDAVGNILEVRDSGVLAPISVTSVTPAYLRRGETKAVTIAGSGFAGTTVTLPSSSLDISGLQVSATQIKFNLTAAADATLGTQAITISSAGRSATANIVVAPLLPSVNVDPAPLAIPPDNVARQFTIRLSGTDTIDHVIALSASNSNITVSPASVTIPAGQLSIQANITGKIGGQANLQLTSVTLGTTLVPVFITAEFAGISTSVAKPLGVVVESVATPGSTQITPILSRSLGVLVGSGIRGVTPASFTIGTGPTTLTISGVGLEAATAVTIAPATGITLGTPVAAPDGLTVSVPVTVAADAPTTQRRVVVKNASGVEFPVVGPLADRISIVRSAPQVDSVEPNYAVADTRLTLTVRGRGLQETSRILFAPSGGIVTDAAPVISADGTSLTAGVDIPLGAPVGNYTVSVVTPGGSSSAVASPANTFSVVNQINQIVTPIIAPVLGVVLQNTSVTTTNVPLISNVVGVTLGPVATGLSPKAGIVGQSITLSIQGSELNAVTGVTISPNTGLTLGSISVAPDGLSVSVPVTIAASAVQTIRSVKVVAGTTDIPFASAEASQFRVTLPTPELDSVTPITLQTGQAPVALTVLGRNFTNATQVKITPSADMSVSSPPVVSTDGTQVTVNISASASAATGARLVSVVTPAGESSQVPVPGNTITLTSAAFALNQAMALPLGIVKLDTDTPPPTSITVDPLLAPAVGVVVQETPAPVSTAFNPQSAVLGIAFGPTAISIDNSNFAPGFSGTLVVRGYALNTVTGANLTPATGITLGTPVAAPDGAQVSIPIAVDAAAARGSRSLALSTTTGSVLFSNPAVTQLRVGPGTPLLDSITPILAKQGDTVTMTIRGSKLYDATAVTANPGSGINFIPGSLVVNGTGTEITVSFVVSALAPLGSRVIQVVVPGSVSDGVASPANTFTVFSP